MSVRTWSFYDPTTGLFTGATFSSFGENGSVAGLHLLHDITANTPPGKVAREGGHDHLSQRVAVEQPKDENGNYPVVDWQPAQPSSDHTWDAASRRWELTPEAQRRQARRRAAQAQIAALEASQGRAVREHLLGNPEGTKRLAAIDAEIAALRGAL